MSRDISTRLEHLLRDDEELLWHDRPDHRSFFAGWAIGLAVAWVVLSIVVGMIVSVVASGLLSFYLGMPASTIVL